MTADRKLPRLVYIGDVPIESSYHGSLLLYRLFSGYPPEKLLIVETDLARSLPERRLPNVEYRTLAVRMSRLTRSRFSKPYAIWLFLSARFRLRKAKRLIKDFQPDGIISVAHGYHWITAAYLAKQLGIPFHLIVHDHVTQVTGLPMFLRPMLDQAFRRAYRGAQNRFCVSPYMEAEYSKRYGVAGTLLYPSRGRDSARWESPPFPDKGRASLRIALAGSIDSGGYAALVQLLLKCLQPDDKFVLFGPHDAESLRECGIEAENLQLGGLLPSRELLERLRQDFDVLFVPMSFIGGGHGENMRLAFPSKIVDYTATGLPLLICGPEYCSAVRWAREYAPVAESVLDETPENLKLALDRLRSPQHREMLGRRALRVGADLFSHDRAESIFFKAVLLKSS